MKKVRQVINPIVKPEESYEETIEDLEGPDESELVNVNVETVDNIIESLLKEMRL